MIDVEAKQNKNELIYTKQFASSPKSYKAITLQGMDQPFLSYVVVQVHAFYFNVTLSLEKDFSESYHQNGTNLGFILTPGNYSRTIYLLNDNYDDVQCLVAVVLYNHSAPVVGGCLMEDLPHPQVFVEEKGNFIVVHTPEAAFSSEWKERKQINCGDNASEPLQYFTYFLYLEPLNFNHDIYFNGIKNLLFENAARSGYQVSNRATLSLYDSIFKTGYL